MVAAAKSSKELGPPVPRQRRAKCCAGLRAAPLSPQQPAAPRSPTCQAGENPPSRASSSAAPAGGSNPRLQGRGWKSHGFGLSSSLHGFLPSPAPGRGAGEVGPCHALADEFALDKVQRAAEAAAGRLWPLAQRRSWQEMRGSDELARKIAPKAFSRTAALAPCIAPCRAGTFPRAGAFSFLLQPFLSIDLLRFSSLLLQALRSKARPGFRAGVLVPALPARIPRGGAESGTQPARSLVPGARLSPRGCLWPWARLEAPADNPPPNHAAPSHSSCRGSDRGGLALLSNSPQRLVSGRNGPVGN